MPTYSYRCPEHGDFTRWVSIHNESGHASCRFCSNRCRKVFTPPRISANATPNKGQEARDIEAREKRWAKDMPAYKRLRDQGVQPAGIDGAAEFETYETRTEIEMGRRLPRDAAWVGSEIASDMQGKEVGELRKGGREP